MYERAIDTTVKMAPIARFSASVVDNPNSGNTRSGDDRNAITDRNIGSDSTSDTA